MVSLRIGILKKCSGLELMTVEAERRYHTHLVYNHVFDKRIPACHLQNVIR